jgi:hypothetical protein
MKKVCKTCGIEKEEIDFYKTPYGTEIICKKCRDIEKYQHRLKNRLEKGLKTHTFTTRKSRELKNKGLKYCPHCERILPVSDFSTGGKFKDFAVYCKECSNEVAEERNQKEKVKENRKAYDEKRKLSQRDSRLKKNFGISLMDYNKILEVQNSKCAICGKTVIENGKSLAVDHDHKTNKIRGLLCNNCNVCIGFLQDTPDIGKKIANYLLENSI